ncbi:MAG: chemotaxis protein CheW [Polyangiaceae bacterium]|nr:chemotaxis protein CheW [Polyangiaceae bacterium]
MSSRDGGFVRIDGARLDRLLHLTSEVAGAGAALSAVAHAARRRHGHNKQVNALVEASEELGRLCDELQTRVSRARIVRVASLFGRFAGLVEDLARGMGKRVVLTLAGEHTEVDKRTIDELAEPLVHLVRNALDHGIETPEARRRAGKPEAGRLGLAARREGTRLVVEVEDDGAGVDLERVRQKAVALGLLGAAEAAALDDAATLELVFHPGFSTRDTVGSVSGRGVGLDAARDRVAALGGRVELGSAVGRGCVGRIVLPLTSVVVDALLVQAGDECYALPLEHVEEVLCRGPSAAPLAGAEARWPWRGKSLAVASLAALLGGDTRGDAAGAEARYLVVLAHEDGPWAIAVDAVLERRKLVLRALGRRLRRLPGLIGTSTSDEGGVVLALDSASLRPLLAPDEVRR